PTSSTARCCGTRRSAGCTASRRRRLHTLRHAARAAAPRRPRAAARISAMGEIAKLLPRANIVTDLDVADKAQFFTAIGAVFEHGSGLARAGVAASLAAREKLGSTGLGQGVAIPHGRIKGLREPVGAYARLLHPIR